MSFGETITQFFRNPLKLEISSCAILNSVAKAFQFSGQFMIVNVLPQNFWRAKVHSSGGAFQRFSTVSYVALKTIQCVCKCGSSAREVSCVKSAAAKLSVNRSFCAPFFLIRVAANASNSRRADLTASEWALEIRSSLPIKPAMETDLGGENVKS